MTDNQQPQPGHAQAHPTAGDTNAPAPVTITVTTGRYEGGEGRGTTAGLLREHCRSQGRTVQ